MREIKYLLNQNTQMISCQAKGMEQKKGNIKKEQKKEKESKN